MYIHCLDENGEVIYSFYQWDRNRTIYIDGLDTNTAPDFHFQNKKTNNPTIVGSSLINGMIKVMVPNALLEAPYAIEGYIYSDSKSIGVIQIPVKGRQQPSSTEYVDNIQFTNLLSLNNEIDSLNDEVNTLLVELTASNLSYNNANSGLNATNIQDAIDELLSQNYVFFDE